VLERRKVWVVQLEISEWWETGEEARRRGGGDLLAGKDNFGLAGFMKRWGPGPCMLTHGC
jgi:hypothetical protein